VHGLMNRIIQENTSATMTSGHLNIRLTLDTANMGANGRMMWSLSMISSPFCHPDPVQFLNISLQDHTIS
jgi:hypothetical protein